MYFQIPCSTNWNKVEKLSKGWSSDEKYIVKTQAGETFLLRLSDIAQYEAKEKEYAIITKYAQLDIPMSRPLAFGVCRDGAAVYMLLTWIEGEDLEAVLPNLPEAEQYRLGRQAGTILKKLHAIPIDAQDRPAKSKKEKKLLQLARYEQSGLRIDGDETAVQYVKDHIDQIWKKEPVYQHGDFHPGNLIYREDGTIGVIDFNRWEVGDPYEEFYKLQSFGVELSVPYCIGQIDAYFDDQIPEDFWVTLAVYVAHASLYSIKWAEKFGQEEIDGMVKRCRMAFEDYNNFKTYIPKWYTAKYQKCNS